MCPSIHEPISPWGVKKDIWTQNYQNFYNLTPNISTCFHLSSLTGSEKEALFPLTAETAEWDRGSPMSAFHSERGSSWGRVSPAVIFLEWRAADQDHFMTWSSALRPLRSEQVRSGLAVRRAVRATQFKSKGFRAQVGDGRAWDLAQGQKKVRIHQTAWWVVGKMKKRQKER